MDSNNNAMTSIETNRELSAILSNFSDDFIVNMVRESLQYKFRPYLGNMPTVPYDLELQFTNIMNHCAGPTDQVKQRREEVYLLIINIICNAYQLQLMQEIPHEQLYSLCNTMYRVFISEFTDIMIRFYSNYITGHSDMIISGLTEEQRTPKSTYSKRIYVDPNQMIMYENIEAAMDMVASLDISLEQLLPMIVDQTSASIILNYIADAGDFYKNHYSSYIRNPVTKTDMITRIKTGFMDLTMASVQQQLSLKEEE